MLGCTEWFRGKRREKKGKSNGLPHGLVCTIFEPAILYWHQNITLLTHTWEDVPSKINWELLQEKRTLEALDSWGKQNTTSRESVRSRVGHNSSSAFREQMLWMRTRNTDKVLFGSECSRVQMRKPLQSERKEICGLWHRRQDEAELPTNATGRAVGRKLLWVGVSLPLAFFICMLNFLCSDTSACGLRGSAHFM